MKNEFDGFFENPTANKFEKYAPTIEQIAQALMTLCGQNPKWYKNEQLRLMAWGGVNTICSQIHDCIQNDRKPDLHIAYAAFLMLLQDRLITSYDEFAGEEERERFPLDDEDKEF